MTCVCLPGREGEREGGGGTDHEIFMLSSGDHDVRARSYAFNPNDFSTISENFENFHIEFASQPMLSYWGGGGTQCGQRMNNA